MTQESGHTVVTDKLVALTLWPIHFTAVLECMCLKWRRKDISYFFRHLQLSVLSSNKCPRRSERLNKTYISWIDKADFL